MSDHLKQFLQAWIEWVDAGAPDDEPFERRRGLCSSFEDWLDEHDVDDDSKDDAIRTLTSEFRLDGLCKVYPFGGSEKFYEDSSGNEMHLNPDRIAWVRSKVAQHTESDLGRAVREVRGGDAPTPKRAFA